MVLALLNRFDPRILDVINEYVSINDPSLTGSVCMGIPSCIRLDIL